MKLPRSTARKLASQNSLQHPTSDQITSAKEIFLFCKGKIEGIKFANINLTEIDTSTKVLAGRFSLAKAIPGTRGYYQFVPKSESLIKTTSVSDNNMIWNLLSMVTMPIQRAVQSRTSKFSSIFCANMMLFNG